MIAMQERLEVLERTIQRHSPRQRSGVLTDIGDTVLRAKISGAGHGMLCEISQRGKEDLRAEIIGLRGSTAVLAPFSETKGLSTGAEVRLVAKPLSIPVGQQLLGRVIDPFGQPIDDKVPLSDLTTCRPVRSAPPNAMDRPMISEPMSIGLRAIDGPLLLGHGQRIGIFGPPGTGKSSLLAAMARHAAADMIVIGLVGERGLEVRQFIERDLPAEARHRVVVVAATSDRPAVERAICASSATAVAEGFRDEGHSVLLLIDSLTRTARALREIGLAAGEAPTRRGYPASVYPALPVITERAGRSKTGSITALYTVLTEGELSSDPIAEEVRSLTDGHIVLSRALAERGHFPAIDVLESLSRTMPSVATSAHIEQAKELRALMAKYQEIELLLQVGEYSEGMDTLADRAVEAHDAIQQFLRQVSSKKSKLKKTLSALKEILS